MKTAFWGFTKTLYISLILLLLQKKIIISTLINAGILYLFEVDWHVFNKKFG
jgi:hypothetical protein